MTPQEFKAWFDGFTEAVDKQPTQKQWARIKERVSEIDGKPVTERVYVDRYLPSYPYPYWRTYGPIFANNTSDVAGIGTWTCSSLKGAQAQPMNAVSTSFDSLSAMNALGHADAAALNS